MTHAEYEYLECKVEDALRHLRKTNKRYSAAAETEGELYSRIKRLTETGDNSLLLQSERKRLAELLEQWVDVTPTVHAELYRQGYLDCLRLVVSLGAKYN